MSDKGVIIPFDGARAQRPASLQPLLDLVADDMDRLNRLILSYAEAHVELIPKLARHLIDAGGKRLRPMITLAAANLCDHDGEEHIRVACAVEFLHTATLLHDDVVDESDVRRGRKAARLLWGNQATVLVGDYLLAQCFRMMVETRNLTALDIMSNAAADIAEGEVFQLTLQNNVATTEDDYMQMIEWKTATLFAAAAELGAVIAGREQQERDALRSYGRNLGIAFQLVDDALDYGGSSARMGKKVGDDFREGKITLPVVLAWRRGTDEERAFWQRVIQEKDQREGDLELALELMKRHGAIADTIERARHYGGIAVDALAAFPAHPAREALMEAVDFCIARAY